MASKHPTGHSTSTERPMDVQKYVLKSNGRPADVQITSVRILNVQRTFLFMCCAKLDKAYPYLVVWTWAVWCWVRTEHHSARFSTAGVAGLVSDWTDGKARAHYCCAPPVLNSENKIWGLFCVCVYVCVYFVCLFVCLWIHFLFHTGVCVCVFLCLFFLICIGMFGFLVQWGMVFENVYVNFYPVCTLKNQPFKVIKYQHARFYVQIYVLR